MYGSCGFRAWRPWSFRNQCSRRPGRAPRRLASLGGELLTSWGTSSWVARQAGGSFLRTLGFAQAPGVLYVAAALPLIGWLARAVVGVWILFAGIVAIREALDFSTGRAVLTALIGWFFLIILSLLFVIPAAVSG